MKAKDVHSPLEHNFYKFFFFAMMTVFENVAPWRMVDVKQIGR